MEAAATFDRFADEYRQTVEQSVGFIGQDLAFFTRAKVYHLRRLARTLDRPVADCSVLDVGCGTGVTDGLLLPHVGDLSGVDVSPGMVAEATARNPGADYQVYDGEELPFTAPAFDLVFAICVVHHVDPGRWDHFVAELWRVTRPNGLAVIIEHNPLNPLTRRSVRDCPFDRDAVLVGPRRITQAFHRAGAGQVRHRYILFAPFGGDRVRAAETPLGRLPIGAQHVVYTTNRRMQRSGDRGGKQW